MDSRSEISSSEDEFDFTLLQNEIIFMIIFMNSLAIEKMNATMERVAYYYV